MNKLEYSLTLLSPVLLSSLHGDLNTIDTKLQISGRVLLGSLASAFIREVVQMKNAHEEPLFYDYFLSGKILFRDAHFSIMEDNKRFLAYKLPLSLFQNKKQLDEYYDLTLDKTINKEVILKGISEIGFINGESIIKTAPQLEMNFHHSRNDKGISEKVFNYESISENQTFIGTIECGSDFQDLLVSFSKWLGKERTIFIGRSKNAQYGKAVLRVTINDNEKVKFSRISELPKIKNQIDKISLTLLSDAIILNESGYNSTDIRYLEKYITSYNPNFKIEKSFKTHSSLNSFNSVWKVKRTGTNVFATGSTFLLNVSDIEKNELFKIIESIELNGLGENTHEGFGQVLFGLHQIKESGSKNNTKNRLDYYGREIEISAPKKPAKISDEFKLLASHLIIQELKNNLIYESSKENVRENRIVGKSAILNRLKEIVNKENAFHWEEIHNSLAEIARKNIDEIQKEENQFANIPKKVSSFLDTFTNKPEISNLIELEIIHSDFFQNQSIKDELNKVYFIGFIDSVLYKIKKMQKGETHD